MVDAVSNISMVGMFIEVPESYSTWMEIVVEL